MNTIKPSVFSAISWMLLALLTFSLMAVAVKELTHTLSAPQIIFFRSLIAIIVISIIIVASDRKRFKTNYFKKHVVRNFAHFLGQYGWIYGIAYIPLAEVFALEFTMPVWTAIMAMILLNEKLTRIRIISIALGFIGVLLILRPGLEIVHPAAIAVLLGAISYGLSHTLTKSLSNTESPITIIFYMALCQLPLGFIFSAGDWLYPAGMQWLWIAITGIAALLAHYAMSRAFQYADATVVVPIDFLRLPLIMLVGLVFYDESIEWLVFVGAAVMLGGNVMNLAAERKRLQPVSAEKI